MSSFKSILAMFLFATALYGCAHVDVVGFDKEAGTVSIQAARQMNPYYLEEAAKEECGTDSVKLLSMQQMATGNMIAVKTAPNQPMIIGAQKKNIYTYACAH